MSATVTDPGSGPEVAREANRDDAIIDAACAAWRNLIAQPKTLTSIGMRDWAHVGQPL